MILDFRMEKHLSSAALGMLVTLSKKAKMLKGDLVICSLNSDLQKLFKITNLDKLLTIKSSEEDSLGVFGRTSAG